MTGLTRHFEQHNWPCIGLMMRTTDFSLLHASGPLNLGVLLCCLWGHCKELEHPQILVNVEMKAW